MSEQPRDYEVKVERVHLHDPGWMLWQWYPAEPVDPTDTADWIDIGCTVDREHLRLLRDRLNDVLAEVSE